MWKVTTEGLFKEFVFSDFAEAFVFIQKMADIAERENHHPKFMSEWNKVLVWIITHSENSVTDKDHQLAKMIDKIEEDKDENT